MSFTLRQIRINGNLSESKWYIQKINLSGERYKNYKKNDEEIKYFHNSDLKLKRLELELCLVDQEKIFLLSYWPSPQPVGNLNTFRFGVHQKLGFWINKTRSSKNKNFLDILSSLKTNPRMTRDNDHYSGGKIKIGYY